MCNWKIPCLKKIRYFVWLICHDALPTNAFRYRRHLVSDPTCMHYGALLEDSMHCLRDFSLSVHVWQFFGYVTKENFMVSSVTNWVRFFCKDPVFFIILWQLQKARNVFVFSNVGWNLHTVVRRIEIMKQDVLATASSHDLSSNPTRHTRWIQLLAGVLEVYFTI